jgi:nitric oxide reductase NorQ protein
MTAPVIPAPAPKGGRLGNGQLRRQVAEWLAARPGLHTVGEVAKALGRSAGAVGNALATLADRNEADRDPGKPVRYWANAKTGAAAAAVTPRPPPRPSPPPPSRPPRPPRRPRRSRPGQPRQRRRPPPRRPSLAR